MKKIKLGEATMAIKRLVIIALEILDNGVGRAYLRVIENASSKEFRPYFEDYISKDSNIVTDEWRGYLPLRWITLF